MKYEELYVIQLPQGQKTSITNDKSRTSYSTARTVGNVYSVIFVCLIASQLHLIEPRSPIKVDSLKATNVLQFQGRCRFNDNC